MTEKDLTQIEKEALTAHAAEELKRIGLTGEEIQELIAKGEVITFYGHFLNNMASRPQKEQR